jgi:hypothetical protein
MKTAHFLTSSCRYCRYYQSEGRRGGTCQQLGVPVQPHWKACHLGVRPFSSTWSKLEEVIDLESPLPLSNLDQRPPVGVAVPEILPKKQRSVPLAVN